MLKRMFPYMHKYREYLWLSCFCVVAETVFELVIPLLMADIIDVGVANQDKTYILLQGSKMIACALLALILGVLYARFAATAGQGLEQNCEKMSLGKCRNFLLRIPIIFLQVL